MTNLQKAQSLWSQLDAKASKFIDTLFPNGSPTMLYAVGRTDYIERKVTAIEYDWPLYRSNKPTRNEITFIKGMVETTYPLDPSSVVVRWQETTNGITFNGGTRLGEIGVGKNGCPVMESFTKEEIAETVARNKEWYAPREGYLPCSYCGQQRPLGSLHQQSIFSPNWKATGYKSPPRNYCIDKPCASHDQMAHEG
jgi:hypothetical protein